MSHHPLYIVQVGDSSLSDGYDPPSFVGDSFTRVNTEATSIDPRGFGVVSAQYKETSSWITLDIFMNIDFSPSIMTGNGPYATGESFWRLIGFSGEFSILRKAWPPGLISFRC